MDIRDLDKKHELLFLKCLEDWSEEMNEAGDHKQRWVERMRERGLRVKLAFEDDGTLAGMIQYTPIEHSFAIGHGLYMVNCIWVHGYPQGVGNLQGKGLGTALLKAAEEDARSLGAKGMAAWGIDAPFWMSASWFIKHGYEKADQGGYDILVWKPFAPGAEKPRWVRQAKTPPKVPGKVSVTSFINGWCPGQNIVYERAKRACAEIGDPVVFTAIDTFDRAVMLEWGIADGLYIDGERVETGPPPSYDSIKKLLLDKVNAIV